MSNKATVTRICQFCGKPFEAIRGDAKYHPERCRMRALRWRRRLPKASTQAQLALSELTAYLQFDDTRRYALRELRHIKSLLSDVVSEAEKSTQ